MTETIKNLLNIVIIEIWQRQMKYKQNLITGKQAAWGENGSWTFRDREPGPVLYPSGTSMEIFHYMQVFFSVLKIS